MNALAIADKAVTMTSVDLLEFVNDARAEFNESPVRHNDFVARCRDELDGEVYDSFVQPARTTATGRVPAFEAIRMTADQCKLVAMRESKGVRRRVLARLNALEASAAPALPSYTEALRQLADQIESNQTLALERDHAIATKAQIGTRREATAMATAAAAKREAARLKDQLGFSARHATILQVEDATGEDYDFVLLRRWCKAHEVTPETVPDKRYPKGVKAWPAAAWMDVYGVDIAALFAQEAA